MSHFICVNECTKNLPSYHTRMFKVRFKDALKYSQPSTKTIPKTVIDYLVWFWLDNSLEIKYRFHCKNKIAKC